MTEREHCTAAGAENLRQRIKDYWYQRGYLVSAWTEANKWSCATRVARVDVRTDMANGLPVRRVSDAIK